MKEVFSLKEAVVAVVLSALLFTSCGRQPPHELVLNLQKRLPAAANDSAIKTVTTPQHWKATETAIVICDMWDKHWCAGATRRVVEMAPAINDFITAARSKGVLIVHAPSGCMKYYENHPARKNATKWHAANTNFDVWRYKTGPEAGFQWPIDSVTQGCNDTPYCKPEDVWTKENDLIEIKDEDIISDSGSELAAVYKNKGIRNVLMLGVHTNMCVIGRSFAIRSLKEQGINVALVRDLTDAMYDSRQWPYVSHFTGVGLVVNYIEQYLCPTVVSSDITHKPAFRFKEDDRK
ncbi:isochorismatase family protein [Niabella aurantiaca]|uniref:isochorismatase family protein n=1 Tax=Niabella aurantiaca TaxID=379900 RepID=UPI0008FBEC2D|nr:isochorismatase family protein [Niabella aurantiaca]